MNWKGHLLTGCTLAADFLAAERMLGDAGVSTAVFSVLSPAESLDWPPVPKAGVCLLCGGLWCLGLLLPDIDLPDSKAARILHVHLRRLRHRGWTHSVWALLPVLLMGLAFFPPRYLGLGMLVHDLTDSLSVAGWAPLYPLGRWKVLGEDPGTVAGPWHGPGLYASSRPGSEELVCIFFLVLSAVCLGLGAKAVYF